jgi:hypothetical protein
MRTKLFCAAAVLCSSVAHAQVVAGQTDTFNANVMNWDGANQLWTSGGGPGGAGDAYLHLNSTGGSGPNSRMAVFNATQWGGNYTAAGVGAIEVDFNNLGSTTLDMRLTFWDLANSTQWNSNFAAHILPGSGWQHFTYTINAAQFTLAQGNGTFAATIANTNRIMFRSNVNVAEPFGTPIVATLGIDNVHATPVPEPATLCALGVGLLAIVRRRRRA